jgi:hypothetical protein
MAKRRKRDPYIDPVMLELTKENADRAPWIDEDGPDAPWYDALEKLDKTKDKTLLVDLLKSDQELTPAIRGHIADLLERYRLKRPPGKQPTPSYALSGTNTRLWFLIYFMGMSGDISIEQAAKEYETDEFPAETLIDAYQGKHGGFARAMKRAKK